MQGGGHKATSRPCRRTAALEAEVEQQGKLTHSCVITKMRKMRKTRQNISNCRRWRSRLDDHEVLGILRPSRGVVDRPRFRAPAASRGPPHSKGERASTERVVARLECPAEWLDRDEQQAGYRSISGLDWTTKTVMLCNSVSLALLLVPLHYCYTKRSLASMGAAMGAAIGRILGLSHVFPPRGRARAAKVDFRQMLT